jgi:signal transduction histidine kinase
MGALCRAFDWASTPLGPVEGWSQSLRMTVSTVLNTRHPMFLWWGPEYVQIYNDGYRASLGEGGRHPRALGMRGRDFWTDIWEIVGPEAEGVRSRGEPTWHEDSLVPIERNGRVEPVYWTYSYSPVRDDDGSIGGVLVVVQETTDRVFAEQRMAALNRELDVERSRLAFIFQQAPAFLAVLRGPEHVFDLVNDAYYQLVGHREILGKGVLEALPEIQGQGFIELLDGVLETGEQFVGREVSVLLARTPGGPPQERFVDFVYLPVIEADGSRSGIIAHGVDVTDHVHARADIERLLRESETARAEAEDANRAKSQFLANMSHEIRTPLNAVVGYADLLEVGLGGTLTEGQQAYVERIRLSSAHLIGLIGDILDLSRIEAGGMLMEHSPTRIRATVGAALGMILPQAGAKKIQLADDFDCPADAEYLGDPDRVRQILVNLLSNAVKFTGAGGRVALRYRFSEALPPDTELEGRGPWIGVEVEDSGIGIAPEQLGRIFDPFVQVDSTHTREAGGTGLGLTISRRLARMMRGDLTVRSRVGVGSSFTLWLPVRSAEAASPAAPMSDWPASPGEVRGLSEIGHFVIEYADAVVGAFARRLATDPAMPHAHGLDRADLEDHVASFLAALGKSLVTLDQSGGEPSLMRDGSEIQHLISDLHGDQRARLGWTEEELRREFQILAEEVDALLLREPADLSADVDAALPILHRLVDRADRVSLRRLMDGR